MYLFYLQYPKVETICSLSGVCLHVCSSWWIKAILFILMLWVLLHAVVECLLWAVLGQDTNKSVWIDVWSLIQGRWYRKWEGKCHCHLDTIKNCRLFTEGQFKCSIIMQYPAGERPFFLFVVDRIPVRVFPHLFSNWSTFIFFME